MYAPRYVYTGTWYQVPITRILGVCINKVNNNKKKKQQQRETMLFMVNNEEPDVVAYLMVSCASAREKIHKNVRPQRGLI